MKDTKTYIIVHPKLNLMVASFDEEGKPLESKMQRVPVGTEIELTDKAAKGLLASKKIKEKGKAEKAKVDENKEPKSSSKRN